MKRSLLYVLIYVCAVLSAEAQTVIDLKPGGGIRAKGLREGEHPSFNPERIARDSLAYVDLLTLGFNALGVDSLDEAERAFRKALKLKPGAAGNEIVRMNIGRIELAQGKFREAVETFSRILKSNPDCYEARKMRIVALLELSRYNEAVADCEALLLAEASGISREEILFMRAGAYMGLRQYVNARTDIKEVLAINPKNDNAALMMALTYDGEGRNGEAIDRINLLLQRVPDFFEALLARADIERRMGADLAARVDYDELIRMKPDRAQLYVARAEVLFRLGLTHSARQDLDRAVELGMPESVLRQFDSR